MYSTTVLHSFYYNYILLKLLLVEIWRAFDNKIIIYTFSSFFLHFIR
jgi:hypothetical protein